MDVKDMLEKGVSPDKLRKMLDEQIVEAQEEINKSKKNETASLNEARTNAAAAMYEYLIEADIIDRDNTEVKDIEEILESLEDIATNMHSMIDLFFPAVSDWHKKEDKECNECKCERNKKDLDDITKTMLSWIKD